MAMLLGGGALWQYRQALQPAPVVAPPGGSIVMNVERGAESASVTVEALQGKRLSVTVSLTMPAAVRAGECMPLWLVFDGMPVARVYSGQMLLTERPVGAAQWTAAVELQVCAFRIDTYSRVEAELDVPVAETAGSVTAVQMPAVVCSGLLRSGVPEALRVEWQVDAAASDLKTDRASDGYRPPGLRWELEAGQTGVADEQYGTFTSVSADKAANQSLFLAGLVSGAAVAVLVWVGELVIERVRADRQAMAARERLPDDEFASVVAERVVRLLDERARRAAPAAEPQAVSRWRGWGCVDAVVARVARWVCRGPRRL
ncbi:hypothetical protein ACQEVF_57435 [Nonomuraea polychroma]|uniref:hypothetical protein n=1 Tax=Nonomuraea polychroma TaxID=46176 RepID=UPI003D94964B